MDVQAATATPAPVAAPSNGASSGTAPASASFVLPAVHPAHPATTPSTATRSSLAAALPANPGLALLPSGSSNGGTTGPPAEQSFSDSVAGLYDAPKNSTEVSYRVAPGSNEIVTVVTNTSTGKVIAQFPSETLIALAQFFQKLDGSVVDKKV